MSSRRSGRCGRDRHRDAQGLPWTVRESAKVAGTEIPSPAASSIALTVPPGRLGRLVRTYLTLKGGRRYLFKSRNIFNGMLKVARGDRVFLKIPARTSGSAAVEHMDASHGDLPSDAQANMARPGSGR